MKINEEIFFKYLSGLLTENEKEELEKHLINSPEAKKKFNELKNKLNSLNYTPEVDERYFTSLLHKVKTNPVSTGKKYSTKLAYVIPVLIFISYLFFYFSNKKTITGSAKEEINLTLLKDTSILTDELFTDFYLTEKISIADDNLAVIAQEELLQNLIEDETFLFRQEDILENDIFNDYADYLTEQELNFISKEIKSKNNL